MWFGYARMELLPINVRRAVPHAIRVYATDRGFGDGEVLFEPIAPEILLRDMLSDLDRADPVATVMPRLRQAAQHWGIDLDRVFDGPRRADVLWHIVNSIEGSAGAQLIVPSHEHLTDLGPSGRAVVAQLSGMRTLEVHYLDETSAVADLQRSSTSEDAPSDDDQVLVETRIGAIPAVAQLDAATELSRLGRPEIIEYVDAIYVALIDDAVTTAPVSGVLEFPPDAGRAAIRLLTAAATGRLIVELEEPRHRTDPVAAALITLCENTLRFTDGSRTFTRCTLPDGARSSDVESRDRG
ncbi:MAG: hypothetical protein JWN03_4235 [Nocardia sp.]|uniref:hypothetical protein n=1 Tax=Nocardia sp. TaxID=1821 RepID=UPI00260BA2D9|nr:hypothetical protein [Nocardia sp.]MCU1643960.1 hypothetical protein [Nocardia sp.]